MNSQRNTEFGILVSLLFLLLAYFGNYPTLETGLALLILTLICPRIYSPFYKGWNLLGRYMGYVTTNILLFILFWLIVVPIGKLRSLWGIDELKLKQFKKSTHSVFTQVNKTFNSSDLTRQF